MMDKVLQWISMDNNDRNVPANIHGSESWIEDPEHSLPYK